ncbi:MAG: hypothetical protein BroJett031_13770 [Betaproteobacteria bacterium]|nr:MAG: hypothetical protein BroJett031_13770 [Betaproteobacteria bacterium]
MSRQTRLTRAAARVALSVAALSALPLVVRAATQPCPTDFAEDDFGVCVGGIGSPSLRRSPAPFALKPAAAATRGALRFALMPSMAVAQRFELQLPITTTAFDGERIAARSGLRVASVAALHAGGHGEIVNDGTLTVRATGDSAAPVVAVGIRGGNGKDRITNTASGTVDVQASATEAPFTKSISLIGGERSTSDTSLSATAIGISGGNGKDTIANAGMVTALATAAIDGVNLELNLLDTSHASAQTDISASAIGIDGGNGRDTAAVANTGTVSATAKARSSSINVEVNGADAAMADTRLAIDANAVGISTGRARDVIENGGTVAAHADAELKEFGLNASFVDVTIFDRNPSTMETTLNAQAVGIDAGSAKNAVGIGNTGSVTATARAFASSTGVSLASEGVPATVETFFEEGKLAGVGITSVSDATALRGGGHGDRISNDGTLTARADAGTHQQGVNVGATVFNWHVPTPGFVLGSAGTRAEAKATGIAGEGGGDEIVNTKTIDVDAVASASSTVVSMNIAELAIDLAPKAWSFPIPLSPVLVVSDSTTEASATARGIDGGQGDDTIRNAGTIDVFAQAKGGAADAAAAIGLKFEDSAKPDPNAPKPPPLSIEGDVTLARAESKGDSTARGIDGGSGRDRITNEGTITATANTYGYAVTVNLDVLGSLEGKQGDAPSILGGGIAGDTSNTATAVATGIAGGGDDDRIVNRGTVTSTADAETVNVNAGVNLALEKNGAVIGVSLAKSRSSATADAIGIEGGEGDDLIDNRGRVSSTANADATSVAVLVNIEGMAKKGLGAGATVIDAEATATASAVGLRAGGVVDGDGAHCGGDANVTALSGSSQCQSKPPGDLTNGGSIAVDADANTTAVNVGASVAIVKGTGVVAGVTLSDTSATARANATGIEGDDAANEVANSGSIGLTSTSQAVAVGVNVSVEGIATGLAAGAALTRSAVNASATATGIAGGAGDDAIVNSGTIATQARSGETNGVQATATTVSVGLEATVDTKQGAAIGAALTDTRATSAANVAGIGGGEGDDEITNRGNIELRSIGSDTTAVGVSLNGQFSKQGLTAGAALALSDAVSTATVAGIAGGAGDDALANEKSIAIGGVKSDSNAVSVSLDIAGAKDGLVLGAALVDADATATTTAAAMSGGEGRDHLSNTGAIVLEDIEAESDSVGVSVDIKFAKDGLAVGAALVETGVNSTSEASGLAAGAGKDVLANEGSITVQRVNAAADAVGVSVGLSGSANGLDISAGLADGSATATAVARGLDGGAGDDLAINRGRIAITDVGADGDATVVSVALTGANNGVAAGVTLADSSATSIARAIGIDGGAGDDALWNKDEITLARIGADTDSVTVGATLAGVFNGGIAGGASLGRSRAAAEAEAIGIDGGSGNDWILNKGRIGIDGVTANTDSTDVSVQLSVVNNGLAVGAALLDTSASAKSAASGLHGGSGNDVLANTGSISVQNVTADADAISVGVSLNAAITAGVAAGVSMVDGKGTAEVRATGMAGGEGNDVLVNTGTIAVGSLPDYAPATVQATAHATGVSVSGNLSLAGAAGGAAIANTSATATSVVSGIDGGAGDDVLVNEGGVDVKGKAKTDALSIGVNVSLAIGLAGGAAITDASSTATSEAYGLDGGGGRDRIFNEGSVRASSEAQVKATGASISAWGLGFTTANVTTTATSTAVGIRNGSAPAACGDGVAAMSGGHGHCDRDKGSEIANRGDVSAVSIASAEGLSISGTLFGAAMGDMSNTATARATGIQFGDGGAKILNESNVSAASGASVYGLSVSATLIGGTFGDANGTATAESTGVAAGAGNDAIENRGALTASANSGASADSISVSLIGAADASAAKTASATARGIASGEGDDEVLNAAQMTVTAGLPSLRDGSAQCVLGGGACATATSVGVTLVGGGFVDASTTAAAAGIGIDGGRGNDALDNEGTLTVAALARSRADSIGVSVIGASSADANTLASASVAGIAGGEGKDRLTNSGTLDASAAAETYAKSFSLSVIGMAGSEGNSVTSSQASGIDGGDDDDAIVNRSAGTLKVGSVASAGMSGSSWSIVGYAPTTFTLGAAAGATGLAGGSGDDWIANEGKAEIGSTASMSAAGGGKAIFGGAAADSQVHAIATATGIDGGEGGDAIRNRGTLDVSATSLLNSQATSFAFAGGAASQEVLSARTGAIGIAAGAGHNFVVNLGRLSVASKATLTSSGGAEAVFGSARSAASVAARTTATGVAAGSGDDALINASDALIDVRLEAAPTAGSDARSGAFIFSDGVSRAQAVSSLSARGVDLGDGDNAAINNGTIALALGGTAAANSRADAQLLSNFLGIDVDAYATSTAALEPGIVFGIRTGSGSDRIDNAGAIRIDAQPQVSALAEGYGDAIVSGDGTGTASAEARGLQVSGIDAGGGDNEVTNRGELRVLASPKAAAEAKSDADGADLFRDPDSRATAAAAASHTRALGIGATGGDNVVRNEGTIVVRATPTADASVYAGYGSDILSIDSFATTSSEVSATEAIGVQVAGTRAEVHNAQDATIDVLAQPLATAFSYANAVGADGDVEARATAEIEGARATGILAAGEQTKVVNEGTIKVVADARAQARSLVDPGWGGEIDAFLEYTDARGVGATGIAAFGAANTLKNTGTIEVGATAQAAPYNGAGSAIAGSEAYGLHTGDGATVVRNDGTLRVTGVAATAAPLSSMLPEGLVEARATAYGALLGNGVNRVDNLGTLQVRAEAGGGSRSGSELFGLRFGSTAHAAAVGIAGGHGGNAIVNTGTIAIEAVGEGYLGGATAVGIATGSGNDTVINRGTITTTQTFNGGSAAGTAIDVGAGNDLVVLGDGSVTRGDINLGGGTDVLTLEGTPVIEGAVIDDGRLALQFAGSGSFGGTLPGTEVVKRGEGTFTLAALPTMQRLDMQQGTLRVESDYRFAGDGLFLAAIDGDGSHGRFQVTGGARLGGSLRVQRGAGPYVNGTTYEVLRADGGFAAGTTFDRIELPAPTRLVGFSTQQLADAFNVRADVLSFTTVAGAPNAQRVAGHLDRVLPTAHGDLRRALGTIQGMASDAEFATAFASLSPAMYEQGTRAGMTSATQFVQTVEQRTGALQVGARADAARLAEQPIRLASSGGARQVLEAAEQRQAQPYGVWMQAFAQRGDQDPATEFAGYGFDLAGFAIGIDHRFGNAFSAGLSFGRVRNTVESDLAGNAADVDSNLLALYGSYARGTAYVDGTLSAGNVRYDSRRTIVVGSTITLVASRHDAKVLALGLGAGVLARAGEHWLDPFVKLRYTRLKEDGFSEAGSGIALAVAPRTTEALVSELGVRWTRVYAARGNASFAPEASLAWLHDFGRDNRLINAAYLDAPDASFAIEGQPVERNGARASLGVTYRSNSGFISFLRYTAELRSGYRAQAVIGEIRYEF